MFRTIDIITSGLTAQRHRLNTIAENVANINTTRDADGNAAPFQRRFVTFSAEKKEAEAVGVEFEVQQDVNAPPRKVYEPNHPDAGPDGYVNYPNINLVTEFVNALEASRAYEANVASFNTTQRVGEMALKILA